ncbi:MAG: TolC family protein [Muribaculaceae bacterium]|nr:TolC family protein [Muribaculaceae bacterium]
MKLSSTITKYILTACAAVGNVSVVNASDTPNYNNEYLYANVDSVWQYDGFMSQPMPDDDTWWKMFEEPKLTRLIALAMQNNYDAKSALHRIKSAEAQVQSLYSGYYPTIQANIGYTANRDSGREDKPYSNGDEQYYSALGMTAQWEIDIFGRIAAKVKAGKADLNISRVEYDGLMVSLAADVALQYFQAIMYQRQIHIAEGHIESQEDISNIVEAKFNAGLVSALDVSQTRSVLLSTKAVLPDLKVKQRTAINALATLCGTSAADIQSFLPTDIMLPDAPYLPGAGAPEDLLRRRPDIVEAELQLAALAAKVGISKKEFLPTLSLSADVHVSAHDLNHLFTHDAFGFVIAPTLTWTIFDGLAREKGLVQARENLRAGIESYNMTVVQAVADVNNAMSGIDASREKLSIMEDVVDENMVMLKLALERYKLGLSDYTDVANAQEQLLTAQTNRVTAKYQTLAVLVQLYRALGGGWNVQ